MNTTISAAASRILAPASSRTDLFGTEFPKSVIAIGQMFLHRGASINPLTLTLEDDLPKVWVKVKNTVLDGQEVSIFVDNDVLVRLAIDPKTKIGFTEQWNVSDDHYGRMVRAGKLTPIDDLRETDQICDEMGWPRYEVKLP